MKATDEDAGQPSQEEKLREAVRDAEVKFLQVRRCSLVSLPVLGRSLSDTLCQPEHVPDPTLHLGGSSYLLLTPSHPWQPFHLCGWHDASHAPAVSGPFFLRACCCLLSTSLHVRQQQCTHGKLASLQNNAAGVDSECCPSVSRTLTPTQAAEITSAGLARGVSALLHGCIASSLSAHERAL